MNTWFDLGWSQPLFAQLRPEELEEMPVGRVSFEAHGHARLVTPHGERAAIVRDPLLRLAVGDWVVATPGDPYVVQRRLEPVTELVRRDPGGGAQVMAANVDCAWLATGLDGDFNLRRLERYLAVAHEARVDAVVVLTKADGCADPRPFEAAVAKIIGSGSVLVVSALADIGREALLATIPPGKTAALVGSSGVGKSTLVNWLLGEAVRATGAVGDRDRGRHTTTDRRLLRLPQGGWLIDNPGMRSLGLIGAEDGVAAVFPDIEVLAKQCRFRDCSHHSEPGCAILAAVAEGTLEPERLAAWDKLIREMAFEERKLDPAASREARAGWKRVHMAARRQRKERDYE